MTCLLTQNRFILEFGRSSSFFTFVYFIFEILYRSNWMSTSSVVHCYFIVLFFVFFFWLSLVDCLRWHYDSKDIASNCYLSHSMLYCSFFFSFLDYAFLFCPFNTNDTRNISRKLFMQILPVKLLNTPPPQMHRISLFSYRKSFYGIKSKATAILFETRFIFLHKKFEVKSMDQKAEKSKSP